jgi:hypothetical protein
VLALAGGPPALVWFLIATAPSSSIAFAQKMPMTPTGLRKVPTASLSVNYASRFDVSLRAAGG